MKKAHIWLRAETKPQEQRTALTPNNAKQLLDAGFAVTVESSLQSIFSDHQYKEIGCELVQQGSWVDAPKNAIILGLKELPEATFPLIHQHIYFAHAYKEQQGWQPLLSRFDQGNGKLYDLEYLVDENNRRVAAFGYWAGFAGAALATLAWANQHGGMQPPLKDINAYSDKSQLMATLSQAISKVAVKPRVIVIGAKGRSGKGAVDVAKELSIEVVEWDLAETQKGGPFPELNDYDILVNCVFISGAAADGSSPAFLNHELLSSKSRKLAVITDVSCDPYGAYNPLPIYKECTTFKSPCLSIIEGESPLNLIAIDHLPSLLPKESSEDYGQQLLKYLLSLGNTSQGVWPKALALFQQKVAETKL